MATPHTSFVPLHTSPPTRRPYRTGVLVVVFFIVAIVGGLYLLHHKVVTPVAAISVQQAAWDAQQKIIDTDVATNNLNPVQQQLYTLAKQELATHAVSYDQTVMKYTDGSQEQWCADFVSWMRNAAGRPFTNPNSGGWRIPGVATLQEYYQSYNAYYAVGDYTPKLGDVAFYTDTSLSGNNSTHVAMILGVYKGNLITIGGNEGNGIGILQVRSDPLKVGYLGLSGFGDSNLD